MTGHLCLKWNNHSSAFLKSISKTQQKERFCDATIACQGTYFPVHRIILSTCSDYFDEMFDRMQCQHPYIVFKDIEPREMELLLNYMYQGEVNVVQDYLPTLIKAAESLKIKGLAVPDDLPLNKDSYGKKRSNYGNDNPPLKRRAEEHKRKGNPQNLAFHSEGKEHSGENDLLNSDGTSRLDSTEPQLEDSQHIKQEPIEHEEFGGRLPQDYEEKVDTSSLPPLENESTNEEPSDFGSFPVENTALFVKRENETPPETYGDQSSSWDRFPATNAIPDLNPISVTPHQHMLEMNPGTEAQIPLPKKHKEEGKFYRKISAYNYRCLFCNYESTQSNNVKSHVMFKHTREKPFSCSFCPKRFVEKIGLERHLRIHTGEKPFACSACPARFSHKISLKMHISKFHL